MIRELEGSDAAAVQRFAGDPDVVRHLPFGPNTPEESRAFVDRVLTAQREDPRQHYEMAACEKGEVIGCVRISIRGRPEDRQGDIGYILRRDRWVEL